MAQGRSTEIISMIKCIRTGRSSIKNSLLLQAMDFNGERGFSDFLYSIIDRLQAPNANNSGRSNFSNPYYRLVLVHIQILRTTYWYQYLSATTNCTDYLILGTNRLYGLLPLCRLCQIKAKGGEPALSKVAAHFKSDCTCRHFRRC